MKILVDPKYDPMKQGGIKTDTELGPGITMSMFSGNRGSNFPLESHYNSDFSAKSDLKSLARNLYLHAEIIRHTREISEFGSHNLIVSEGIYAPNVWWENKQSFVTKTGYIIERQGETPTKGGINDLRRTGECVVYQLINSAGVPDISKTFDLAVYWKDYLNFDLMILDYDSYDPRSPLTPSIVLVMPTVKEDYDVEYKNKVATVYNGELQTQYELIEIFE